MGLVKKAQKLCFLGPESQLFCLQSSFWLDLSPRGKSLSEGELKLYWLSRYSFNPKKKRDRRHSEMPKCFKEESSLQCLTNFFQTDHGAMATFRVNDDCLQLLNHCMPFWLKWNWKLTFLLLALIFCGFDVFIFMREILSNIGQYLHSYVTILAS